MTLHPKSIIIGIGSAILLKFFLASYWWPLLLSIMAATKIDKDIDYKKGMIYGLIIGSIITPFSVWIDNKDFGPIGKALFGIFIMTVIAGLIGALFGKIFKGKETFMW